MKEANLLVDVSGSFLSEDISKSLEIIFKKHDIINFIQFNTEVKSCDKITKESKIPKYIGGGGTMIQPAFDLIIENENYKKLKTYIFTDGYTEKASFLGYDEKIIHLKPIHSTDLNILISDKSKFKIINI